jgi:DNA-binding XRE family transcriptional regulator
MNETKTLGARLKECREKKNLKQADVARALNIQRQIISYYENDSRQPDIDKLKDLAMLYGVSTDYLLGLSDLQTSDTQVIDVCKYTGLSENAVAILHCNAAYKEQYGTVPEETLFDTIEQAEEYPFVNVSLLDASNLLIEHGYDTLFFEMLLNYIYSDYIELVDGKGKTDFFLKYRNEKLSSGESYIYFESEQTEAFAFLLLQRALKDIRNVCAPEFEKTLLGKRAEDFRRFQDTMDNAPELE